MKIVADSGILGLGSSRLEVYPQVVYLQILELMQTVALLDTLR